MVRELTLFDLFGEPNLTFVASVWPPVVQRHLGITATWPPPDLSVWLGQLNNGVTLANVRTGAAGDRLAVEAQLQLDNVRTSYSEGFPFVIGSMPDVEFRIQTITDAGKYIQLFASASDRGAEIVLEGLPVEIRLPIGLIELHPEPDDHPSGITEMEVGDFTPGNLDDLKVVYRSGNPTSIFVHVRLHMNEDFKFTIRPAVPISFGKCTLSSLPCLAVHDFSLIPSPEVAPTDVEWLRHSVMPLVPSPASTPNGLFAARSVHLDANEGTIKDFAGRLNSHTVQETHPDPVHPNHDSTAAFVLDDLVVPFYSAYIVPIPRHITVGVRRNIIDPEDERQIFSFEGAPVNTYFSHDPAVGFILESLFYRSLPIEDISTDLGLTFSAAIFFGEDNSPQSAFEIGLGENYTIRLGYRRDFSSTTGMPEPGTGVSAGINAVLHWEIASILIDIMAFRVGYSLGRWLGENKGFGDCFEATVDVFISSTTAPVSGKGQIFQLRSLNGQRSSYALEGVGWRQGAVHFERASSPDGMALVFFDTFAIIIQEIGLIAESGASYLSFTAGLAIQMPSGFYGEVIVRRLRFRVAGNPDAPFFKLDGFFGRIISSTVKIEFGGYFTDTQEGDTQIRELGLTGTVGFSLSGIEYLFGLDLLIGNRKSPLEAFDYFMFQTFFRGQIIIAWFELRGVRVLFANNMQPKLEPVDRDSRDLRYFTWYKSSNPLTVGGDRRLAAWQAKNDAWAFGIGVSCSIAGLGKAIELGVFVLCVFGPDEQGLLIVGEVFLLKKTSSDPNDPPKPVGYFALEWDGKNDRFSLVIGIDIKIETFLSNPPSWSRNIAKLTGTLFISNDPGTFAIGRLADMRTWLSLTFDINLWLRTFIQFGLCFEYVEGPDGPKGFGLVVRLEGGINAGIVRVTYNAGFGVIVMSFQTGSSDYAAAIWIEAGLRIKLWFLRFGISARAEYRTVGASPSRGELRAEIRLETPWFLPDVTWTFEITFGNLAPADLATSVSALRVAASHDETTSHTFPVYLDRFDPNWNGEGAAPTYSVNQLRAPTRPEAQRLANFAAASSVHPISTDSTISIEWSVAVNDQLALGGNVAPNLGDQHAGDLTLRYDLVRIAVRRRSRFGSDRSWRNLTERIELSADFSDPAGVDLSGSFAPQELTAFWDPSVRIAGQGAAKKLLFNASTPFQFSTSNPEVDEEIVRQNPEWPCCGRRVKDRPLKRHEVEFRNEPLGADIQGPRLFSESHSRFNILTPAYARQDSFGTIYAFTRISMPDPVFRAELDEDAAFFFVVLGWGIRPSAAIRFELLAFDSAGEIVARRIIDNVAGFRSVLLAGQGPIRRVEGRLLGSSSTADSHAQERAKRQAVSFIIVRATYVGLRDYLNRQLEDEACREGQSDFSQAYEGRGKLFFLPNHEYEIALTTRVEVAHPSTSATSADVEEFIYFKTKGLPGLNAVPRVGAEIEPYVNSAYNGGRGILYREEPVTLAFKEDFHIAVPLALRPPGTSEERITLLRMQLLAQPNTAATRETPFTSTGSDWIVDHRASILTDFVPVWMSLVSSSEARVSTMTSDNPFRERLAILTQREKAHCELDDPRKVIGSVLVAPPQGTIDASRPGQQLWPARTSFSAAVRLEGAGFVDRRGFAQFDNTAFDHALDATSGDSGAWSVVDSELRVDIGDARRFAIFGEPIWNHLTINAGFRMNEGSVGIGVALPAGNVPTRGLFAVVELVDGERRLTIYRRNSGVEFAEIKHEALPDAPDADAPVTLVVTAFDDILRASVGEVLVEVERDELREGRLSLFALGAAQFTSLQVTGLDLYTFPFNTSRFISFEDHIESFQGTLDVIAPNSLGSGTTTATTSSLWAATQTEIAAAMQPDAEAAARQTLFDRWVHELGLPLKDELTALEISRFNASLGTELFLIESPEPLDFTEEITLTLSQRVLVSSPWDLFESLSTSTTRAAKFIPDPKINRLQTEIIRQRRREQSRAELQKALELPGSSIDEGGAGQRQIDAEVSSELVINDLIHSGNALRVELDPASIPSSLFAQERIIFVEAIEHEGERRVRFFAGAIERKAGGRRAVVHAKETDELILKADAASTILSESLAQLETGRIAAVDASFTNILGLFRQHYAYEPVDVRILQDSTGRRAIVIPISSSLSTNLPAGTYRMKFHIERRRWHSNDPPDNLNGYHAEATLVLTF